MSESFAEMLEESIKQIHTGEIVDGKSVRSEEHTSELQSPR